MLSALCRPCAPEGAQPAAAGVPWAPTELYLAPPNPAILQQFPPGRDLKDFCHQGYKLGALQPCNQDASGNMAEPSPGAACSCLPRIGPLRTRLTPQHRVPSLDYLKCASASVCVKCVCVRVCEVCVCEV